MRKSLIRAFYLSIPRRSLEAVDEALDVCRTDVAADHLAAIDEKIRHHLAVVVGIVRYFVCIAHHFLALISRKVKPLTLLYLVISAEDLIKLRGYSYAFTLDCSALGLPAELL